jgi:hypothetical protein
MKLIDNFLDESNFSTLKNFVESMDFPWFYIPTVSLPPDAIVTDTLAKETSGFNHTVFDHETNLKSFFFQSMPLILTTFEEKFQIKIKKLLRIRLGMKHPKIGFTEQNYNLPHVDYFYPHGTLIYYINDSDGDTFVFNEFFNEQDGEPTKFSVQQRVTPRANRMLYLENGLQYHTASNPIMTDRRMIININFIT